MHYLVRECPLRDACAYVVSLLENLPKQTSLNDRLRFTELRELLLLIQGNETVDQNDWNALPNWATTTRDLFRALVDEVNLPFGQFATGPFIQSVRELATHYEFSVMLHTVGTTAYYLAGRLFLSQITCTYCPPTCQTFPDRCVGSVPNFNRHPPPTGSATLGTTVHLLGFGAGYLREGHFQLLIPVNSLDAPPPGVISTLTEFQLQSAKANLMPQVRNSDSFFRSFSRLPPVAQHVWYFVLVVDVALLSRQGQVGTLRRVPAGGVPLSSDQLAELFTIFTTANTQRDEEDGDDGLPSYSMCHMFHKIAFYSCFLLPLPTYFSTHPRLTVPFNSYLSGP
jgi:hypothetical protein